MRVAGAVSVLLICSFLIYPLEISCNGSPIKNYTDEELRSLTYYVVLGSKPNEPNESNNPGAPDTSDLKRGVSLDELLPLMARAHLLRIKTGNRQEKLAGDDIAEKLSEWYLIDAGESWELAASQGLIRDISGLDIRGDRLTQSELEVWVSWEGTRLLKEEITRFADIHALSVKTTEVPKIDTKLISILRGGGRLPDVVMVQSDYLPTLIRARALQNLDYMLPAINTGEGPLETQEGEGGSARGGGGRGERAGGEEEDEVRSRGRGGGAFYANGKTWAIPFYADVQLIFYSRELVPDGLPPTMELADLERICSDLQEEGLIPLTWNAYSAYWLIPFQIGFGWKGLDLAGESIRINDGSTEEALDYILNLRERGLMQIVERDGMISLFVSGKIAMILSGSYSIPHFDELGLDYGIAAYPYNAQAQKYISPLIDYKALAITRKSHNSLLARRLIQYLSGIGVQQRFPVSLSKLPANRQTWKIAAMDDPRYTILIRSFEIGTQIPPLDSYAVYKNTMWKLLRLAISGQMAVSEVLAMGQEIIDRQIEQIGPPRAD